jgi:glycosyltransferase involved in cell wall biosynthesis
MPVSVVIPAYNEAANLPALHARLVPVLEGLREPAELVIVDDGSVDGTAEVARSLDGDRLPVRVVCLARNFGNPLARSTAYWTASRESTFRSTQRTSAFWTAGWSTRWDTCAKTTGTCAG